MRENTFKHELLMIFLEHFFSCIRKFAMNGSDEHDNERTVTQPFTSRVLFSSVFSVFGYTVHRTLLYTLIQYFESHSWNCRRIFRVFSALLLNKDGEWCRSTTIVDRIQEQIIAQNIEFESSLSIITCINRDELSIITVK